MKIHRLKKIFFYFVQNCTDEEVHTLKVGNSELFWAKMIDVQNGLGAKNISDLVRKEIQDIFETKIL